MSSITDAADVINITTSLDRLARLWGEGHTNQVADEVSTLKCEDARFALLAAIANMQRHA